MAPLFSDRPAADTDAAPAASQSSLPPTMARDPLQAPPLGRRLLCMVYEAVILFGIVFLTALAFGIVTQQRNGLNHRHALDVCEGVVIGAYFIWFWSHGGQTLPMKTWRIQVVAAHGMPLSMPRAALRFVACALWWVPPLALHPLTGLSVPHTLLLAGLWLVAWAAAQWLDPARQFLHDRLAGTRLVGVAPRADQNGRSHGDAKMTDDTAPATGSAGPAR